MALVLKGLKFYWHVDRHFLVLYCMSANIYPFPKVIGSVQHKRKPFVIVNVALLGNPFSRLPPSPPLPYFPLSLQIYLPPVPVSLANFLLKSLIIRIFTTLMAPRSRLLPLAAQIDFPLYPIDLLPQILHLHAPNLVPSAQ